MFGELAVGTYGRDDLAFFHIEVWEKWTEEKKMERKVAKGKERVIHVL